jgi:hypothetical protein
LGKYSPCKWGKNRLSQESFQKNSPDVTTILFLELNRQHINVKLCSKFQKY